MLSEERRLLAPKAPVGRRGEDGTVKDPAPQIFK